MNRLQKGLDLLLEKYSVKVKAEITNGEVKADGEKIPLLPWENERRFFELREIVGSGKIGKVCTYRIGHTARQDADLFKLLEREAGIAEFTLGSEIKEVFAIGNANSMNCILEAENGCICTIELAATLERGEAIDKHEIIAQGGVACDRVVDTQMPQQSVYVLGKKEQTYTDTDNELFGYSQEEITLIRNAFAVAADIERRRENIRKKAHLERVVEAAKCSLKECENCRVEENGKN